MFYIRTALLSFALFILFNSCDKEKTAIMNLTIASKRFPHEIPEGNGLCFIVKYEDAQEWSLFWYPITGFDYREGYEYVINVTETQVELSPTMMDAMTKNYTLNYIISCVKKESEDIPAGWVILHERDGFVH
jgi:hypothetical protein